MFYRFSFVLHSWSPKLQFRCGARHFLCLRIPELFFMNSCLREIIFLDPLFSVEFLDFWGIRFPCFWGLFFLLSFSLSNLCLYKWSLLSCCEDLCQRGLQQFKVVLPLFILFSFVFLIFFSLLGLFVPHNHDFPHFIPFSIFNDIYIFFWVFLLDFSDFSWIFFMY